MLISNFGKFGTFCYYALFFKGREMKFQTMFQVFEKFKLGEHDLNQLYNSLASHLQEVEQLKIL